MNSGRFGAAISGNIMSRSELILPHQSQEAIDLPWCALLSSSLANHVYDWEPGLAIAKAKTIG